jgi:hypothetical protein
VIGDPVVARRGVRAAQALSVLARRCLLSPAPELKAFDPSIREELVRACRRKGRRPSQNPQREEYLRKGDALERRRRRDVELPRAPSSIRKIAPAVRIASLQLMVDAAQAEPMFRELIETHPERRSWAGGLVRMEQLDWRAARSLVRAVALSPDSAIATRRSVRA